MHLTNRSIEETKDLKIKISNSTHPRKDQLLNILDKEIQLMDTELRSFEATMNQQTRELISAGYKPYAQGNLDSWERVRSKLLLPLVAEFWSVYSSLEENQAMEQLKLEKRAKALRIKNTLIKKYGFDPRVG